MNPRNTCILVVLALGLFAFIYFFERHIKKPEPEVPKVLPGVKASEVTSITIEPAGQKSIQIDRTNGVWELTKPIDYPAQGQAVESLLATLEGLSPQTRISGQELLGRHNVYEEYGFAASQVILVIRQGEKQTTLMLGSLTAPGDHVYVQVVGFPFIDVIDVDVLKLIRPQANDWRDTAFVDLRGLAFDRVSVANGAKAFDLQRDPTNKLWRLTLPGNMQARADNSKIENLLLQLQGLHVIRFETDDPKADPEAYGFQAPALELNFERGTNQLLRLQFGRSPTNDEGLIYARRDGQAAVVSLPRAAITAWRGEPSEFRDPHLINLASGFDLIEGRGPMAFTVRRQSNNVWRVTEPYDFPADTNLLRAFVGNLARLTVVRGRNGDFAVKDVVTPEEFPKYGLAQPAQKYIVRRNTATGGAGGTNGIVAELDFGKAFDDEAAGGKIYVRRGDLPDESSVYAVKTEDVQALPTNGLQLRDRRIWSFAGEDVSQVTLRVNGKPEKLIRKGPGHWGIAPGSQAIFEEMNVEASVQDLGDLSASAWVERGAQNCARYGISGNSLEISFEVNHAGKTQTRTVDFGRQSPRGLRYAMVRMDDEQDWIFEFPSDQLDRMIYCFNIHENATP